VHVAALHADTRPLVSLARTLKQYVEPGLPVKVAPVAAVPLRQTSYDPNPPFHFARR
jgi:hypothetical protein